ncbi:MAG: AmmeMemoRadiSam system protein B [Candidatus Paceibacterota bacterium]
MNKRTPYAAGLFYLGYEEGLTRDVKKLLKAQAERESNVKAKGVVVPHAGYEYSGPVAGSVYGAIDPPKRFIIIGPNHSGFGFPISIEDTGTWKTPLGNAEIDEALAAHMMANSKNIKVSYDAHRLEHSVEVQLPFLQVITGNDFTFVPVAIKGLPDITVYREVGHGIAEAIRQEKEDVLIVASTDFTHYEPLPVAESMDKLAIEAILAMDPEFLLQTVYENDITMCGVGPVATMLYATKELGATKAELIKYATSADFSMDTASVVGYGGLVVS